MKLYLYIFTLTLIFSITRSNDQLQFLQEDFQDYSMYVMSIQMATTLCLQSKECDKIIKDVPKNILTLHGLWPSIVGEKLRDCNKGAQIDIIFDDKAFSSKMQKYWPSLYGPSKSFWDHEYNKHGFCWVMKYKRTDPDDFFRMTMKLYHDKGLDQIFQKGGFDLNPGIQRYFYYFLI